MDLEIGKVFKTRPPWSINVGFFRHLSDFINVNRIHPIPIPQHSNRRALSIQLDNNSNHNSEGKSTILHEMDIQAEPKYICGGMFPAIILSTQSKLLSDFSECYAEQPLPKGKARCGECGGRILYKKRERRGKNSKLLSRLHLVFTIPSRFSGAGV